MVDLEPFKFVRLNRASVEPHLFICDAWWLLYLSLLILYLVICITVIISHLCTCVCKLRVESEISSKCVIGI
jgi:ABC-type siderophore export system fused ATPase/permease subunit